MVTIYSNYAHVMFKNIQETLNVTTYHVCKTKTFERGLYCGGVTMPTPPKAVNSPESLFCKKIPTS